MYVWGCVCVCARALAHTLITKADGKQTPVGTATKMAAAALWQCKQSEVSEQRLNQPQTQTRLKAERSGDQLTLVKVSNQSAILLTQTTTT